MVMLHLQRQLPVAFAEEVIKRDCQTLQEAAKRSCQAWSVRVRYGLRDKSQNKSSVVWRKQRLVVDKQMVSRREQRGIVALLVASVDHHLIYTYTYSYTQRLAKGQPDYTAKW